MKIVLLLVLVLALVTEGVITSLPLVLIVLIISASFLKAAQVYWWAFIAGIILDVLLLKPLGLSSAFYLAILFLISLYEKKFEISSPFFVSTVVLIASGMYFIISPFPQGVLQSIVAAAMSLVLFLLLEYVFLNRGKRVHL